MRTKSFIYESVHSLVPFSTAVLTKWSFCVGLQIFLKCSLANHANKCR